VDPENKGRCEGHPDRKEPNRGWLPNARNIARESPMIVNVNWQRQGTDDLRKHIGNHAERRAQQDGTNPIDVFSQLT
jgi:hypothetical protein